jgi:hypothetical protein
MNDEHIRYHIRKAVSMVSGITIDRISDDARFDEDLGMDSDRRFPMSGEGRLSVDPRHAADLS